MKNSQVKIQKSGILFYILLMLITACTSEGQSVKAPEKAELPKTSIHEAAFFGNTDVIEQYVKAGADLNGKDAYGSSALTIAATFGKTDVAKLLIDGGADIEVTSGDGSTPLITAAFFCRKEIVRMLLEKGADVTARNNFGSTAYESVSASFADVKPIYDQLSKDLGPLGLKFDYDYLQKTRPEIARMIQQANQK